MTQANPSEIARAVSEMPIWHRPTTIILPLAATLNQEGSGADAFAGSLPA
jgi:hypothetical protein